MVNPYGLSDRLGKNKWVTETEHWRPFGPSSKPKCAHDENRRMIRSFRSSSLPTGHCPMCSEGSCTPTHTSASLCPQQSRAGAVSPASCTCRTRLPGQGCSFPGASVRGCAGAQLALRSAPCGGSHTGPPPGVGTHSGGYGGLLPAVGCLPPVPVPRSPAAARSARPPPLVRARGSAGSAP